MGSFMKCRMSGYWQDDLRKQDPWMQSSGAVTCHFQCKQDALGTSGGHAPCRVLISVEKIRNHFNGLIFKLSE